MLLLFFILVTGITCNEIVTMNQTMSIYNSISVTAGTTLIFGTLLIESNVTLARHSSPSGDCLVKTLAGGGSMDCNVVISRAILPNGVLSLLSLVQELDSTMLFIFGGDNSIISYNDITLKGDLYINFVNPPGLGETFNLLTTMHGIITGTFTSVLHNLPSNLDLALVATQNSLSIEVVAAASSSSRSSYIIPIVTSSALVTMGVLAVVWWRRRRVKQVTEMNPLFPL